MSYSGLAGLIFWESFHKGCALRAKAVSQVADSLSYGSGVSVCVIFVNEKVWAFFSQSSTQLMVERFLQMDELQLGEVVQ